MFCRNCGKELPDEAKFCNQCGQPVKRIETTPEPEPVVIPEPEPEPAFIPEPEPLVIPEPEPIVIPAPEAAPTPEPERTDPPAGASRVIRSPKRQEAVLPEEARVPQKEPTYGQMFEDEPELPEENRPLSAWAYFGYRILFMIPVIGFILLIVFSFAGRNVNRKNFARSYWWELLVVVAILLILFVLILTGVFKGAIETAIAWLRDTGLSRILKAVG